MNEKDVGFQNDGINTPIPGLVIKTQFHKNDDNHNIRYNAFNNQNQIKLNNDTFKQCLSPQIFANVVNMEQKRQLIRNIEPHSNRRN